MRCVRCSDLWCFSRRHLWVWQILRFFRAFLRICWVKEFLEGMAAEEGGGG